MTTYSLDDVVYVQFDSEKIEVRDGVYWTDETGIEGRIIGITTQVGDVPKYNVVLVDSQIVVVTEEDIVEMAESPEGV